MKIIFLIDATFSERDFVRFGLATFAKNNIEVSLWDFSLLRRDKISKEGFESEVERNKVNRYIFENFKDINHKIKHIDKAFVIDQRSAIFQNYSTCWFQEKGAIIVRLHHSPKVMSIWKPTIKDYFIILQNNTITDGAKKTAKKVFYYFYKILSERNKMDCYDINVSSGSVSQSKNGKFEINSHNFDYDIYLNEKGKKLNSKNYIVFLDNGMVNHPDYQKLGMPSRASDEIYYPLLRSFFDCVEKKIGLEIIVAVHPRLNIDEGMKNKFGERELISGKSSELVKNAKLVLVHNSTSINFAVLWRIPLIVVTTDEIERSLYPQMEILTQILKNTRVNINQSYHDMDFLSIAQEPIPQYNDFIEKIIKINESPIQNSTEILIKGLEKYVQ